MPPLVTVHTPTWNRASTLPRVWKSLCAQTVEDFEWIVGDDGSEDHTLDLVGRWRKEAPFDVVIHNPGKRVGKAALDNWALRAARGRFFLTADSDDSFEPDAIERFLEYWESIPESERDDFVGVVARCKDRQGKPLGRPFPFEPFDSNFLALTYEHGYTADHWHFCRTNVLREYPFPEVDWFVPEGLIWYRLGKKYKVRCVNDPLKTAHYGSPNAISGVEEFRYSWGRAYALAEILNDPELRERVRSDVQGWAKTHLTFGRYAAHTGRSVARMAAHLDDPISKTAVWVLAPLFKALATKDRLQGRVVDSNYDGPHPEVTDR